MRTQLGACLVCLAALSLGCSGRSGAAGQGDIKTGDEAEPAEHFSHVVATEAEYYTTGPQQGRPPDGKFSAGTKVTIRRRTGGYALVRAQDGVEAYVSMDALKEIGAAP